MSHADSGKAEDKAKLDAHFEKVAQTYEKDGGGVPNSICRDLLALSSELNHPITKSSVVLDNASGPGILTGELLKQQPNEIPEMHAADFSAAMIRVVDAKGWGEKYGVKSSVMDAQDLQYPDKMFTHIFMNLGIFALPDPVKGTRQIHRTLNSGGIALVTTLKSTGWVPPFQKAQGRVKPDAAEFQGMMPPAWSQSEWLQDLLEQGGFGSDNVIIRNIEAEMSMTKFRSTQDGIIKMARNLIVKGWTNAEAASFDKVLDEELEIEEKSGIPRFLDVWVGIATK